MKYGKEVPLGVPLTLCMCREGSSTDTSRASRPGCVTAYCHNKTAEHSRAGQMQTNGQARQNIEVCASDLKKGEEEKRIGMARQGKARQGKARQGMEVSAYIYHARREVEGNTERARSLDQKGRDVLKRPERWPQQQQQQQQQRFQDRCGTSPQPRHHLSRKKSSSTPVRRLPYRINTEVIL